MTLIQLDAVMPLPESWGLCLTCEALIAQADMDKGPHQRGLEEYPSDWQADFQRFLEAILDLSLRYGDSVLIRIWDPRSLQGLFKAIRYCVHRYPSFIVSGQKKIVGLNIPQIEEAMLDAGAILQ
ncbi:MAG: hypothetical protein A2X25_05140 [Chloroflexi bacterium GWB2_49_20]|nr:MAG: hypothetical protein A2X25_05140 [Chloroflexi bacterium GWB2_49_20]OGN78570.1 MAG: hypothetical protein A2X26_12290 [Chloroflexi bacterium GWC2_49_37]OGN83257.1 MAG: hypothetical protein A2X27_13660 [Chloroflexi bacterium GWD2_49_16]HBG75131.1 hypothetical protein [Anaerolineae bacterium]HCC78949.1 hypothetical protein [Anaerolineae bacterium]